MAIAIGNYSSKSDSGSGDTTAFDSGTGANRVLIVGFSNFDSNATDRQVSSVSYGGQALTKVANSVGDNATSNARSEIWYLIDPPTGSNNIAVTFAGANDITNSDYFYAVFTGVDQSTPINDSDNHQTTGGTQDRITLTTTVDGCVLIDVNNGDQGTSNYTVGAGQTELMNLSGATGLGSYKAVGAAGSYNMDINTTASDNYAHGAIALAPAASGYTSPFPSHRVV